MERQLQGALTLQKQYQGLYEAACLEYERLWNEYALSTSSSPIMSRMNSMDRNVTQTVSNPGAQVPQQNRGESMAGVKVSINDTSRGGFGMTP